MLKAYNAAINFPPLQTPRQRRVANYINVPSYKSAYNSPRVTINVSGMRFETYEETLGNFPDTLLGSPSRRMEFYSSALGEYIFTRDRSSFDAILFFYQSRGILAKPPTVSEETFMQEIEFYGLPGSYYSDSDEDLSASQDDVEEILPLSPHKRKLWLWFEYPRSSKTARILALWAIFVIVFSTVVFCIETIPALALKPKTTYRNVSIGGHYTRVPYKEHIVDYWFVMEGIFVAWFTIEYSVRLYSAPVVWHFVKSTMGILDVLAIMPFYVTLAFQNSTEEVRSFAVLRAIRLFRVLRVFKLSRYSDAVKLLVNTIYSSVEQLKTLGFCIIVAVVVFSSAIFYAEGDPNIASIPDAFWWTIITMTSVGYGDVVPITPLGKFVGSFCAMSGVVLFCLPTPVLVSNFVRFYLNYGDLTERKRAFAHNLKQLFLRSNK